MLVWPPRPLQPLVELNERKFAHSLRFAFPRMTAPPARSLAATVESRRAGRPSSANEPAVVCIRSPVSMLSFRRIGNPVERPEHPSLPAQRVGVVGDRERVGIDLDDGIQVRSLLVERLNAFR